MQRISFFAIVPLALFALSFATVQGGGGSQLGRSMEEIDASIKALQKVVESKEGFDEALPEVTKLEKAVIDAKAEVPESVAKIEDAKARAKATLAYKLAMADLVRACLDLEAAMLADDPKKADKALRAIDNLKSGGHSQFRPRDGR